MSNEKNIFQQTTQFKENDLRIIGDIFALDNLNYIDINLQQRLARISAQWPLLVECMALPQSEQEKIK